MGISNWRKQASFWSKNQGMCDLDIRSNVLSASRTFELKHRESISKIWYFSECVPISLSSFHFTFGKKTLSRPTPYYELNLFRLSLSHVRWYAGYMRNGMWEGELREKGGRWEMGGREKGGRREVRAERKRCRWIHERQYRSLSLAHNWLRADT